MSAETLRGDQAIFTSVRTPMGEGYRIIAASKGLGPRDKQTITRRSPSHEGLCRTADANDRTPSIRACTFYALSKGRFCVALSCPAGAEHTGRGGQRVYTHNFVIDENGLRTVGYNPFIIHRSMIAKGFDRPNLKPAAILPPAELDLTAVPAHPADSTIHESLSSAQRCHVLDGLLAGRSFVVNLAEDWLETAEAVLLGVPGPLRTKISFGAGVRFSVGRMSRLHVLHDDTLGTRSKLTGQPVEYVDSLVDEQMDAVSSTWVSFVDRHWKAAETAKLARRTSRAFSDCGAEALGRVADLYDRIDGADREDSIALLGDVHARLAQSRGGTEAEIVQEYLNVAQKTLMNRIANCRWAEVEDSWKQLVRIGSENPRAEAFAGPLVEQALRIAMRDDPRAAARVALELDPSAPRLLTHEVLENLERWTRAGKAFDAKSVLRLCDQWSAACGGQGRTDHTRLLDRIRRACAAASAAH